MTAQEYVITVTHYMTERDGAVPEQTKISLELSKRCLDMLCRIQEEQEQNRKLQQEIHELMHKLGVTGIL